MPRRALLGGRRLGHTTSVKRSGKPV
jgi:hypothetical protein